MTQIHPEVDFTRDESIHENQTARQLQRRSNELKKKILKIENERENKRTI